MRFIFILVSLVFAGALNAQFQNIYCKHFIHGHPIGNPTHGDLIVRDLYALCSNDSTKFADWVSYKLTPQETMGDLDLFRKWRNDPWLDENETLEATPKSADDYTGAYAAEQYDRGHLAPLASFKGSKYASQVNCYSNIVPQLRGLNRGPWKTLEGKVRELVDQNNEVWVIIGPLYEDDMPDLPQADERHTVPSHFWKIIVISENDSLLVAGFIMSQEDSSSDNMNTYLVRIRDIETRSGFNFFTKLSQNNQDVIETNINQTWINSWIN